jgi:hypothetical protein
VQRLKNIHAIKLRGSGANDNATVLKRFEAEARLNNI